METCRKCSLDERWTRWPDELIKRAEHLTSQLLEYMAITIFAYISPICREAPLEQIYMKFCMRGHLTDVINRAKFYLNQIRGFDPVGVEFLTFP